MRGEIIIMRNADSYIADGKKIPDELIVNLLSAIDDPVIAKPDMANLGITDH